MNFLAPLFLFGALAIAAPVIFHLIRRTTRERTVFSSLMFLLPTPPRLTRRNRLEHWLLLLLRCLALGLLAFGFARPFLKQAAADDSGGASAKRIVVLVDTSASMRRAGLWADARAKLEAVVRDASPGDQVAVFTFDRTTQPLLSFSEWTAAPANERAALALGRFGAVTPGWSSTNLGTALINAAESLADTEGKAVGPRRIVVITDLQSGSRLDTLQAYEWPKGIEVAIEPLKAHTPTNASVQLLAENNEATDATSAATVRLRVSNAADGKREQFRVGWAKTSEGDFVGAPIETYVPPGQSRVVTLPAAAANGAESVVLRGDDEAFDNVAFVIPPVQQKMSIVYLGAEKAEDAQQPLFFLQRALPNTPRLAVTVAVQSPANALSPEALAASRLSIVTDALPPASASALREQVLAGKTVLFALKNPGAAAALGPVLGIDQVAAEEVKPASYAMLAEIDFQHPLFAVFADPRFSDFTKIHFWKYRRLNSAAIPGARVLAKFDAGDPALLEIPVGKGRVYVLASGWNPDDSQLALSSKFVPLVYAFLELSGTLSAQTARSVVGDPIALPAGAREAITVQSPDGKSVALPAGTSSFAATTQPGIYRLTGAPQVSQAVAVNLDAAEARTAPLPVEELERLGVPLTRQKAAATETAARETQLQGAAAESRQKLWRWFILATLAVLFAESLLAGWTARKPALAAQPQTP